MKLLDLHIDGFGKFHDRDLTFSDGLNVVYGKNEAGNHSHLCPFYAFWPGARQRTSLQK